MISLTALRYINTGFGVYFRFYRLFYNFVALSTVIPLIYYSYNLKGDVIFIWQGYIMILKYVLLIFTLILFLSGYLKYDTSAFIGIRQINSGKKYTALSSSGKLDSSGILGIVRHPWYLAALIFIWISYREMYVSRLTVNIILTIYLVAGTILEERKLIIELGDDYRNYMSKVSMLFPYKWMKSKFFNQ
jgi:protein-S-isoprenylcysteine O-methyltransferase Ste14